jgi:Ca-activated chloride channel homolog
MHSKTLRQLVILFSILAFVPGGLVCPQPAFGQAFHNAAINSAPLHSADHSKAANYSPDSSLQGLSVDAASILVTARNETGDYISQLKAKDFQVFEDGEEQPIVSFREDTVPVNVVFLIDASYSMTEVLPKVLDGAVAVASRLRKGDRYSAVLFAHKPVKIQEWTEDPALLKDIVLNVKTFGHTALYDSMEYAIRNLLEPVEGKKAIIIWSDGVDNSSARSLAQAMELAADHGVTVYPIIDDLPEGQRYRGMAKDNRNRLKKVSKVFLSYLDTQNEFVDLVARNGGRIIWAARYQDMKTTYNSLIEELKNQYAISYVPQPQQRTEKAFKELTVKLRDRQGQVLSRLGYFEGPSY